jgi:hypothetical protein
MAVELENEVRTMKDEMKATINQIRKRERPGGYRYPSRCCHLLYQPGVYIINQSKGHIAQR